MMHYRPIKDDLKITMRSKHTALTSTTDDSIVDLTEEDFLGLQMSISSDNPYLISAGNCHHNGDAVHSRSQLQPARLHVNLKPRTCRSCEKSTVKNLYDLCETCDNDQRRKAAILRGARMALAEYESSQLTAQIPQDEPIITQPIITPLDIKHEQQIITPQRNHEQQIITPQRKHEPPRLYSSLRSYLANPPKLILARKILITYISSGGSVKDNESAEKLWNCDADTVIRTLQAHLPANHELLDYPTTWRFGRIDTSYDFLPNNIKLQSQGRRRL